MAAGPPLVPLNEVRFAPGAPVPLVAISYMALLATALPGLPAD